MKRCQAFNVWVRWGDYIMGDSSMCAYGIQIVAVVFVVHLVFSNV